MVLIGMFDGLPSFHRKKKKKLPPICLPVALFKSLVLYVHTVRAHNVVFRRYPLSDKNTFGAETLYSIETFTVPKKEEEEGTITILLFFLYIYALNRPRLKK